MGLDQLHLENFFKFSFNSANQLHPLRKLFLKKRLEKKVLRLYFYLSIELNSIFFEHNSTAAGSQSFVINVYI